MMVKIEETTRTPGPWRVGDAGHTVFGPRREDGRAPKIVAQNLTRQNARLIAAAPDLLEAARRALDMMADIKIPNVNTREGFAANVTRAALAAAIAKTEGGC